MDVWTKHFHDMATGKLETMHKSVHTDDNRKDRLSMYIKDIWLAITLISK